MFHPRTNQQCLQEASCRKQSLVCPFCALVLVSLLTLSRSTPVWAQNQQIQVVELTAKKFGYPQSAVHVKARTKVQLKITALDHDHGFKFPMGPPPAASRACSSLLARMLGIEKGRNHRHRIPGANPRHLFFPVLPLLRYGTPGHEERAPRGIAQAPPAFSSHPLGSFSRI